MARTITAAERARLSADSHVTHIRVQVENPDGVLVEMTDFLGLDWFASAKWSGGDEQTIVTGTLSLHRWDAGENISLAPEIGGSPANRDAGGGYAPLLELGRRVLWQTAVLPRGIDPIPSDFTPMFDGVIAFIGGDGTDVIALTCQGKGGTETRVQIEEKREYGDPEALTPAVDALQALFDDWMGEESPTIVVAPGTNADVSLSAWEQDRGSLMEAARAIAEEHGADLRYRWTAADVFALTYRIPNRDENAPYVDTITPDDYFENGYKPIEKDIASIRNAVTVEFTDAATGDPGSVTREDPVSIAKYRVRQWAGISRSATSTINSLAKATKLAEIVVHDLAEPPADHGLECLYMWHLEDGDRVQLLPNGVDYDSPQVMVIATWEHDVANGEGRTRFTFRGRVRGTFRRWTGSLAEEPDLTTPLRLLDFRREKKAGAITFRWRNDRRSAGTWVYLLTRPTGTAGDPWPDLTDAENLPAPAETLGPLVTSFDVPIPAEGTVTYAAFVPMSAGEKPGQAEREIVESTGGRPTISGLRQYPGASGLFTDLKLSVTDPDNLGGVLSAWLNAAAADHADPDGPPDGTIDIDETPAEITASSSFTTPAGPAALFDNVRTHPGRPKRVYFEFTNANGISSGVVMFGLLSDGAIVDEEGDLLPGSIKNAADFAAGLKPIRVGDEVPDGGTEGDIFFDTDDGRLYRFHGGAWEPVVRAPDLSGVITAEQLAAESVGRTQFASDIRPVRVVTELPSSGNLVGDAAYLTTNGKLYRWNGAAWTSAIDANDVAGVVSSAPGPESITLQAFTASVRPVRVVTELPSTGNVVGDVALLTSDTKLYRWTGSAWTRAIFATDLGDQVQAGQLAANSVTAGTIAVGAVQASALSVYTLGGLALNSDPNTSDASAWERQYSNYVSEPVVIATGMAGAPVGTTALTHVAGKIKQTFNDRRRIPIDPSKQYLVTMWVRRNATASAISAGLHAFRENGTLINSTYGLWWTITDANGSYPAADTWLQYRGVVGAGTARTFDETVKFISPGVVLNDTWNSIAATGQWWVQDVRVQEMVQGTQIRDGSITAGNLTIYGGTGAALNADPGTGDITAWEPFNDLYKTIRVEAVADGPAGGFALTTPANVQRTYVRERRRVAVDGAKQYSISFWATRTADAQPLVGGLHAFGSNGAQLGSASGIYWEATEGNGSYPAANTWTFYRMYMGNGTTKPIAGTSIRFLSPAFILNASFVNSTGQWWIQGVRFEEVIPSVLIRDGAIVAAKIGAGEVRAGHLFADAVTAGTIAASAVNTREIAAGAITASLLHIYAGTGGALNADPNTSDAAAWEQHWTGQPAVVALSGPAGALALTTYENSNMASLHERRRIPVDSSKQYRVQVWVYRTADAQGGWRFGLDELDANGAQIVGGNGIAIDAQPATPPAATWTKHEMFVGAGTPRPFRAATRYMRPVVMLNEYYVTSNPTGRYYVQGLRVEEVLPSTLIKDGAIITAKLDALAVTAQKIAAFAVEADKINANAVQAHHVSADSIWAGSIQAGAVRGEAIFAGAVEACHISVQVLSEISEDAGIILNGKLQTLDGQRWIDLDAAGAELFIKHPGLNLHANGDAIFSGALAAASGTFRGTLDIMDDEGNQIRFFEPAAEGGSQIGALSVQEGYARYADFTPPGAGEPTPLPGWVTRYALDNDPDALPVLELWADGAGGRAATLWNLTAFGVAQLETISTRYLEVAQNIIVGGYGTNPFRLRTVAPAIGELSIIVAYRNDQNQLVERILSVGAPDSEGPGFRRVRIAN